MNSQLLRLPFFLGALGVLTVAAPAITNNAKLVSLDGNENVCMAVPIDTSNNTKAIRVVKRAANGTLLWAKDYAPISNTNYVPTVVRADTAGNVYVAGYVKPPTGTVPPAYLIMKYGPTGTLLWTDGWDYSNGNGTDPQVTGMDLNASGAPIIVGTVTRVGGDMMSFIVRYDTNGVLQRNLLYYVPGITRTILKSIEVDSLGRVLVGGTAGVGLTGGGGMDHALFARFEGDTLYRSVDWIVPIAPNTSCTGLAIDAANNVFESFTTTDSAGRAMYGTVKKFDATAASQIWSMQIGTGNFEASAGVIVDTANNVLVGGASGTGNGSYRLAKLSGTDGSIQWNSEYSLGSNGWVAATSIGQDAYGNYMMAGDYQRNDGVREMRIPYFTPSGGAGGYYFFAYTSQNRALGAIPSATPGTLYVASRVWPNSASAPYQAAVSGSSLLWWGTNTSPTP